MTPGGHTRIFSEEDVMNPAERIISVIGASVATPEQYDLALRVGRLLAEAGAVVVCGGRGGVMEGVCRGVREAGGISVGILPTNRGEANPYVTIPVTTGIGEARNVVVVSSGDAVISIGGGPGTLSEIGLALKIGKPVVFLSTWDPVDECGVSAAAHTAADPAEAVSLAFRLAGEPERT
jgi:uncharacterized protein (TIGR00725 family)